jgi:asparagine synthase (glutamine-hydrolysing)
MCGICGFYNVPQLDQRDLLAMTRCLAHRGPDGEGLYKSPDGVSGLGHRRLAILDLTAAGHQPMTIEGSGLWAVFNGEVYNFLELRNTLEEKGHRFITDTDTEVVLAAWREWRENAFDRLNGMWALALYDETNRELLLCRDRFGVKPLFWMQAANGLIFASEPKALRVLGPPWSPGWDLRGMALGIANSFELEASGRTLFTGVRSLPQGHYLVASASGIAVRRWWSTLNHIEPVPQRLNDQAARFYELFEDACRLRMRSDVPIGTSLSGGLDSGSIVTTLASVAEQSAGVKGRMATSWQRAFNHRFPGTGLDESSLAEETAKRAGVSLISVVADESKLADEMDRIVCHLESVYPGMTDSLWRVYQAQRANGVVVSLDGHGADEMLGGYDWHISAAMAGCAPFSKKYLQLFALRRQVYAYGRPRFFRAKTILQASPMAQGIATGIRRKWQERFLRPGKHKTDFEPAAKETLPKEWDPLQRMLYRDFHWLILPRILRNYDFMSMAHGVEVRMPFLDYRLVSYCFSLPSESKISPDFTKAVLRQAMLGKLPESVRACKQKIGFNSPVIEWLAGPLRPWVEETLRCPSIGAEVVDVCKLESFYRKRLLLSKAKYDEALAFWSCISVLRLAAI